MVVESPVTENYRRLNSQHNLDYATFEKEHVIVDGISKDEGSHLRKESFSQIKNDSALDGEQDLEQLNNQNGNYKLHGTPLTKGRGSINPDFIGGSGTTESPNKLLSHD